MEKENKYYVYGHYLKDGTLFYIGKGCGDRHSKKYQRPKSWQEYVGGKEWYSVVLHDNLTNSEALNKEREIIDELKDSLINSKTSNLKIELDKIKEFVYYDPTSSTGLRWVSDRMSGHHNLVVSAKAHQEAGHKKKTGYICITCRINRTLYTASRIVWFLVTGVYPDPDLVVDHLDGNSLNNNFNNLKLCSQRTNSKNKKKRTDNISGFTGVYFSVEGKYNYWKADYSNNGKIIVKSYSVNKHGLLPAFYKACLWRKEQIRLLNEQGAGYTERHGT